MAQQADVVRIKRELDAKIHQLDKSKKSLQGAVGEANRALERTNGLIEQQREEIKELLHARAELMDQVTTLKDTDLSQVHGEIEQSQQQVGQLDQKITRIDTEMQGIRSQLQQSQVEIEPIIQTLQSRLGQGEQLLTDQGGKLGEFRTSLIDYQQVLTTLREAVKKQEKQIVEIEKHVDEVAHKQDTQDQHLQARIEEVGHSIHSLIGKLGQVSATVATRLDEHEQKLLQVSFRQNDSSSFKASSDIATEEPTDEASESIPDMLAPMTAKKSIIPVSPVSQQTIKGGNKNTLSANGEASSENFDHHVLSYFSSTSASAKETTTPAPVSRVNEEDTRIYYQKAFNFLRQKEFEEAAKAFSEFLRMFPKSTLAANAQYWLGESYYGQRQFQNAIDEFERVFAFYPSSNKVPASLLKIGYSHMELQERTMAQAVFQQLVRTYPQSPEAIKAHARLQDVNAMLKTPS